MNMWLIRHVMLMLAKGHSSARGSVIVAVESSSVPFAMTVMLLFMWSFEAHAAPSSPLISTNRASKIQNSGTTLTISWRAVSSATIAKHYISGSKALSVTCKNDTQSVEKSINYTVNKIPAPIGLQVN